MSVMPPVDLRARPSDTAASPPASASSPAALRLRRPGWRDPRLAVGLLLVAVSTVVGARLLAVSDDTVTVWATAGPVRAGDAADEVRLVPSRVDLEGDAGAVYLPTDRAPEGVFTHDLAAGELVSSGALGEPDSQRRADLAVAVEAGNVPVDLAAGDLVDVWSVPEPAAAGGTSGVAERVLEEVPVTAVESGSALGATGRQVVVQVDRAGTDLGEVIGTLSGGTVVLVRVGG